MYLSPITLVRFDHLYLLYIGLYISYIYIFFYRANLSDSYFTNRQDRYVLLEDCQEVADFFAELVGAVGDVSLQLAPDDSVHMMEGMVHPYKGKWYSLLSWISFRYGTTNIRYCCELKNGTNVLKEDERQEHGIVLSNE